jgi:hypothetical protein
MCGVAAAEIRLPAFGASRTVALVFVALLGAVGIAGGVASHSWLVVFGIAGYALAVYVLVQERRVRVVLFADELSVRNFFRSFILSRSAIQCFQLKVPSRWETIRQNRPIGGAVVAVLRDGSEVWLFATGARWDPQRRATNLALLQDWLDRRPSHT